MALELALKSVPSTASLYLRALVPAKRVNPPAEPALLARATLKGQTIDAERLQEYRRVCGFSSPAENEDLRVPATYPFVMAMPLQLSLLVSEAFPYPVLGIVHVRNVITQQRPVGLQDRLDFSCELSGPRSARRGMEFDLVTRVYVAGTQVWECVSTMLHRGGAREKASGSTRRSSTPKNIHSRVQAESAEVAGDSLQSDDFLPSRDSVQASVQENVVAREWAIGSDMGRRYARVSGDRNPIHLYALSAKLFGFPSAIAHGMWTKARCLAELEQQLGPAPFAKPFKIEVKFRKPVMLPTSVLFTADRCESADARPLSTRFAVKARQGSSAHLQGVFEAPPGFLES